MSISLKALYDQVQGLVSKPSEYKETVIYSGSLTSGNCKLLSGLSNFKIICIESRNSSSGDVGNGVNFIPISTFDTFGKIDIYIGGDGRSSNGRHVFVNRVDDTTLSFSPYDCNFNLYKVKGLNLYYKLRAFVSEVISCLSR